MKAKYEEVIKQKEYLEKLACGIDPSTDRYYEEDTILNNARTKRVLKEVSETLNTYSKSLRSHWNKKEDFSITADEKKRIDIADKPITVSHLVHDINISVGREEMKKLKATQITEWLEHKGFLITKTDNNADFWKIPTEKGEKIGIIKVEKTNSMGKKYSANLYTIEAQQFVISKLEEIVNIRNQYRR